MSSKKTSFDLGNFLKSNIKKPEQMGMPQMVMFIGKPGSGKTWLAASEARYYEETKSDKKVLLLDTEGSTVGTTYGLPEEYLDILPVPSWKDLQNVLNGLMKDSMGYGTVIIDTFDVYHDEYIASLKRTHRNEKGLIDTRGAWGVLKEEQMLLVNRLKRADFRVIIVNHAEITKMSNGDMYTGVALSGSTKNVMPGKPDIIGFTRRYTDYDENGKSLGEVTTVDFRPGDDTDTKNRFNLGIMKDADMSKIYALIKKKQETAA